MAGQADRGRAVLAERTRVGQGVYVDRADDAVLIRAHAHMHFHLVARRACDLTFLAGVDHFGGLAGFPRDERGVHLGHDRLLRAEAAADARLFDVDLALGDVQRVRDDAAHMEHDLRGRNDVQAAVVVDLGIGAEGLHHGLLAGLGVVDVVDDLVAACQHRVHVAVAAGVARAQVAPVVRPDRTERAPVVLRVHQNLVVLGCMDVEHRLEHLIFHFDELQRLVDRFFAPSRDDRDRVAHKAHAPVKDQPVIGRGLGEGLPGHGEPLLRHVFISEHTFDARHLHRDVGVDLLNERMGVRRAQHLDHQTVVRGHVVHIGRPAEQELHGVLFAHRLVYHAEFAFAHACAPFLLSRYARMPRSWPS